VSVSRLALIAVGVAAGVSVLLVVATGLGWWNGSAPEGGGGRALSVTTSLAPTTAFFGDPLVAEVDVQLDRAAIGAGAVRVDPSFAPYAETGAPAVSSSRAGNRETVRYRYALQCVSDACLPTGHGRSIAFAPVVVRAVSGTRRLKAIGTWQPLNLVSRLTSADVASSRPNFRRGLLLPPPVFGVAPGPFADGLTAAAALLVLAGLGICGVELARLAARRRRSRRVELTPLELALLRARESASRLDPADRRKAVGALAETLAAEGRSRLAESADDLAWSEAPPTPARTLTLVDEVEAGGAG
jgi:hypothetical protein